MHPESQCRFRSARSTYNHDDIYSLRQFHERCRKRGKLLDLVSVGSHEDSILSEDRLFSVAQFVGSFHVGMKRASIKAFRIVTREVLLLFANDAARAQQSESTHGQFTHTYKEVGVSISQKSLYFAWHTDVNPKPEPKTTREYFPHALTQTYTLLGITLNDQVVQEDQRHLLLATGRQHVLLSGQVQICVNSHDMNVRYVDPEMPGE
ncbi:hypothetical protein PoB_003214300 [Plakobranchus ocellatus]|uniref:Uncharacterized protein n=1 Tax=Plakobranchus ocellatus TaxID=259542 RepID=A0AAV4AGG0_9GAST|nr:hypothetical protein PoB_003214300 [Plakobranchus ocellatus]